ncbi:MAG: ASKHA domain-containing protein [Candidatus Hydrogenedentes bacterium]|nr:ASKHA domain-containing protein [Candidatus Hydrogenedentota bacterium]
MITSESGTKTKYMVEFLPAGLKVEVPGGTTVLDAARIAGVVIDSLCGGDGVCGKCRVIVRHGIVRAAATQSLTREEIRQGYVLACEARIDGNVLIDVPTASQVRGKVRDADAVDIRVRESGLLERQRNELDPLVKKHCLRMEPARLENPQSDLNRLYHELAKLNCREESQLGLSVLRRLPGVVRNASGVVTVTSAHRGALTEITDIVSGDSSNPNLAVAVDIGTTSVVAHLIDVATGQSLSSAAKYNSQAVYGGDVLRRIMYCIEQPDGLTQLHTAVIEDINTLIRELLDKVQLSENYITFVVAAGNTTIMHTVMGMNPEWIRREPYVGVSYQPPPFRAAELGIMIHPRGLFYSLPCVSSFIGADITAGVLATGMTQSDEPRMLIDIGTNGEIVIGNKDWMVCASASAGPAFEGAETRDGMRATCGAIDHIRGWSSGQRFSFSTVGNESPCGLCGTAYVDLLAQLLRLQVMDKTGRLNTGNGIARLRKGAEGEPEFVVVKRGERGASRDLVITQSDIANLMRAKAAVYAASKILLTSLGLTMSDLSEIMVAGAFGNFLDLENAVFIGLLPDVPGEKLRFVGNTSLVGAKMAALDRQRYQEARRIANSMTYFELSTDPRFMEAFTSACFFPHTNIEEFPSVMAKVS